MAGCAVNAKRIAVLLALGAWPVAAEATMVTVTTVPDFQSDTLRNVGSFNLWAYSQQYGASPAGPNATTSIATVLGGSSGTRTPIAGRAIAVPTGFSRPNPTQMLYDVKNPRMAKQFNYYGPTVMSGVLKKSSLTTAGDQVTLTSTSGAYTGQASAFISAKGVRGISASASVAGDKPPAGDAAAQADDPFAVPSGSAYAYDPGISASFLLDSPGVAAGFQAFAFDSSVFTADSLDNFFADGSPLDQTLWYLAVGGDDDSDVAVDFQINPLALDEIGFSSAFLNSLAPYTDQDSEAASIDQAIDQLLAAQMTRPGDGTVGFSDATLLPAGTTFTAAGDGVDYADGAAAIVSAPEPPSLAILAVGWLALAGAMLGRGTRN